MKRVWLGGLLGILATAGAWGCGDATSNRPAIGGAGGMASNTSASDAGGNGTAGHATAGSTAGGNAGGSSAGSASAGASGAAQAGSANTDPILCGGAYPRECATDKLCAFDTGCGTVGHCTRKPTSCDKIGEPTCGCDGKTYGNPCEAERAGIALQHDGACDDAAQFTCGPYACAKGTYCIDKGAKREAVWRYACVTLPAACAGEPSCDCLGDVKSCFVGHDCAVTGAGVTATCQ